MLSVKWRPFCFGLNVFDTDVRSFVINFTALTD